MAEKGYIRKTSIPGLIIVERPTFPDERGHFREAFRINELEDFAGITFKPVQWNHSLSLPNVIRGLHAENWNKVIYPATGKMLSFFIDLRTDSPTFAKVEEIEFDEKNPKAVYVPQGVANSVCVIGETPVHYFYLVDKYYDGKDTFAIAWDDPDLNIKWPVKNPIISERDRNNPTIRKLFPEKFSKK